MQKYLYKEKYNEDCTEKYSYYLVCDDEKLGVEVSSSGGSSEMRIIDDDEENVFDFLKVLADNEVHPVHMPDILEDRKTERFLDKLSRNLIQAYLKTTLHGR